MSCQYLWVLIDSVYSEFIGSQLNPLFPQLQIIQDQPGQLQQPSLLSKHATETCCLSDATISFNEQDRHFISAHFWSSSVCTLESGGAGETASTWKCCFYFSVSTSQPHRLWTAIFKIHLLWVDTFKKWGWEGHFCYGWTKKSQRKYLSFASAWKYFFNRVKGRLIKTSFGVDQNIYLFSASNPGYFLHEHI